MAHPHRRRLPRHARHIVRQMLKLRAAARGSILQAHVRQLDSAVNLREHPDRLHPDTDRHALGVRVRIGPETRSLLRQLLESRDFRVQQQLAREIIHQIQRRVLAAARRVVRWEKIKAAAVRARARAAALARRARLRALAAVRRTRSRAQARFAGRPARAVGSRTPATRTRGTRAVGDRTPAARTRAKAAAPARAGRAARS